MRKISCFREKVPGSVGERAPDFWGKSSVLVKKLHIWGRKLLASGGNPLKFWSFGENLPVWGEHLPILEGKAPGLGEKSSILGKKLLTLQIKPSTIL